jgi:hypothetical protein
MPAAMPEVTVAQVEEAWAGPFETTSHQCHAVSLAIVRAGLVPGGRVARGACRGVVGQHSWVTVGDPYVLGAPILDATLWSYDPSVEGVWTGRATNEGRHVPHGGAGSIWTYGRPPPAQGEPVALVGQDELSRDAQLFLELLGPLDRRGWAMLADAPVLGWPAAEIIAAMDDTPELRALVPIDRLGMLTDRNPSGLYLPGPKDVGGQLRVSREGRAAATVAGKGR